MGIKVVNHIKGTVRVTIAALPREGFYKATLENKNDEKY